MTYLKAIKKPHLKAISITFSVIFIVIGLIFFYSTAFAATTITVTDNWTWNDLKTAIEQTHKGENVIFNINRTTPLSADSKITISNNTTVTLICTNNEHTTNADISREKNYHDNLFQVNDGNTLNLRCCLNGGYKDGSSNNRGYFSTGVETDGYYGKAMVINYGTVNMDNEKSVIKYNYNAKSTDTIWTHEDNKYHVINTNVTNNENYGSAVLNINGNFNMKNGQIYGCIADNGPAVCVISNDTKNQTIFSNGKISNNIARQYGGAVYIKSSQENSDQTITTISGTEIKNNLSRYNGGGVWNGSNSTLRITDGKIYNNKAIEKNGGGIANSGILTVDGGNIYANSAINGGGIYNGSKLTLSNGDIYSNKATGDYSGSSEDWIYANGGGIYNTGNANFTMSGGNIYDNSADNGGGIYSATSDNTFTMSGGNVYGNATGVITYDTEYNLDIFDTVVPCFYDKSTPYSGDSLDPEKKSNIGNGGGIYSGCKTTIIKENATIGFAPSDSSDRTTSRGNVAYRSGGGIFASGNLIIGEENDNTSIPVIQYNRCKKNGAGVFVTNSSTANRNGSFKMYNGEIHNNQAAFDYLNVFEDQGYVSGGGIFLTYNTTSSAIYGGEIYYNESINYGGGIVNQSLGGLTVFDGNIHNNKTYYNFQNEELNRNFSSGGGIFNSGLLTISGGEIYENTAGTKGGGVYNTVGDNVEGADGSFVMTEGSVYNNEAGYGGGIYFTTDGAHGEIKDGSVYGNTANNHGGGICSYRAEGLTITGSKIYNNTSKNGGGGIYDGNTVVLGGMDGKYVEIYNNTTTGHGGGGVCLTAGDTLKTYKGTIIGGYRDSDGNIVASGNNAAAGNGGGVYVYEGGTAEMHDTIVCYNNADEYGGGVYCNGIGTITINDSEIHHNSSSEAGGGVSIDDSAIAEITDTKIHDNTTYSKGGGIACILNSTLTINNGEIFNNSTTKGVSFEEGLSEGGIGGGIFFDTRSKSSIITGTKIYNNTANEGAGIYSYLGKSVSDFDETFLEINSADIYENTLYVVQTGKNVLAEETEEYVLTRDKFKSGYGGGIYNSGNLKLVASNIRDHSIKGYGAGVYNNGTLKVTDDSVIQKNTASEYDAVILTKKYKADGHIEEENGLDGGHGGGIYVNKGTTSLTDGFIQNNTAHKGKGVYVHDGYDSFEMSQSATVDKSNNVFLENNAFITVPSEFEGEKNIRAVVTSNKLNAGRVIAKYGANKDDTGSTALYWDTSNLDMSEQYFAVNGHILRSGDQGAAENTDSINKQDVFLSAKYNIDFDMNLIEKDKTITHVIGTEETVFDDLENKKAHTITYKYWNEPTTIKNTGHASYSDNTVDFVNWALNADGTGTTYEPDKQDVLIAANINENITFYAQWSSLIIDVDYNGNGATEGENWTEENILLKAAGKYKLSDKETAFERTEALEDSGTRLFRFMGWSFDKNSPIKEYDFGQEIDSTALKAFVKTAENRDRQVATVYAVWDEFPTIEAIDRWFTLDEAHNGDITLAELLSSAKAIDGDVGDVTDFYDKKADTDELHIKGKEEFTIIDFDEEDFKAFTASGNATVTYKAVDSVGNETYKTIVVHIVDKAEHKYDETTLFTRFISSKYFTDENGNFIDHNYGGLNKKSRWRTEPEYVTLLSSALSNAKEPISKRWDNIIETWDWSMEEIEQCKSFVTAHGVGNIENPNALNEFYNQFGPEN